jgi:hypothetical protein
MRKHICFAIAAATMGLAMIVWAKAGMVASNGDVVRPKVVLSSPMMSNPYLQFQVLDPVY